MKGPSRMLAHMSHEIRSPLNAILGFTDLLGDERFGRLSEEQRKLVGEIGKAANYLLQLIGDVLDIARVDAGKINIQPERLSVSTVVQQSLTMAKGMARDKMIKLSAEVEPEALAVWADERRLKQILYNLLSNAIKFSGEGTRVQVRAWEDGERARISVTDQGIGIAPEDQERIFEEFVTLDRPGSPGGTGLGLAVTRRLVEIMGGRITVDSQPGQGATFSFTLLLERP